ncbi:hypothetical protein CDV26_11325 [Francisella halioticida]|uniref:DNA gyrase subunit B n=1 Tax=Francisella halioticida TaxID=549298 RepID=A0ABM6M222_9GAMM|nr:hypothetical protein CDV26_11325 [Francisella halioticida]
MKNSFKIILISLTILYPFIVFVGIKSLSLKYIGLLIALLFCLRSLIIKDKNIIWKVICIMGVVLAITAALINNIIVMQLYPIFVNIILFGIFSYSLFQEKSIITKFAERVNKLPLPTYAIKYTWCVTFSWCIFFCLNALVSTFTVFGSIEIWTLYNGLISYLLIGLLATIEIIIRFFIRRQFR